MAEEIYSAFAIGKSKEGLEIFQGSSFNRGLLFQEFMVWTISKSEVSFAYLSSYNPKAKQLKIWELEENEVGFIPKLIKKKDYDDFFNKNKAARTPYIEFMLQILQTYLVPFWNKGKAIKLDLSFLKTTMRVYCDLPEKEEYYKYGFEVCT